MKESINFNRAATFYDATRKLRDDIADQITNALLAEIRGAGADRVLEVGIGTGRIARPLMSEGVQVVGVDISTEMMGQLAAQLTPEHTPPELLLGDATALPFRDGSFRAAMVVHVLHLVKSVEDTVAEIKRVLAPGGVLLQQTRYPDEQTERTWQEHEKFWDKICANRGHKRRRRPFPDDIARAFRESSTTLSVTELATFDHQSSVEQELQDTRERKHSWSWEIPDAILDESMGEFERWLREHAGPDGHFVDRATYVIEAWRWA